MYTGNTQEEKGANKSDLQKSAKSINDGGSRGVERNKQWKEGCQKNEKFKRTDQKKYGAPTINGRTHINSHPLSHLCFNSHPHPLSRNIDLTYIFADLK
ncbi:hypothetical protein CDAR_223321 [Caerostris darwini]|uniref:Uncharacterized protein n=1 Tax=Caerostris darwini TaxID=1538125 RepID=A0AAV4W8P8_9ARAC|nr:hypothetical protein CDAR_223321 [Caerostris darwini]